MNVGRIDVASHWEFVQLGTCQYLYGHLCSTAECLMCPGSVTLCLEPLVVKVGGEIM